MKCGVEFFSHFTSFSSAFEADCSEIKHAMQLPIGGSGAGAGCISVLEDALDGVNQTRDKSHTLLKSLASPTLQELVEVFSAMCTENQADLELFEGAISQNPSYVPFFIETVGAVMPKMVTCSSSTNLQMSCGSSLCATSPTSHSAPLGYMSPAPIPSHLQVEPKTPDLDDFGISSFSLQFLQSDAPAAASRSDVPPMSSRIDVSAPVENRDDAKTLDAMNESSSFPSSYNIEEEVEERTSGDPYAIPPGVNSHVGGRGSDAGAGTADLAGSDTMFPLMQLVSDEQFNSVPEYLRSQISCDLLNSAVTKINDYVTDKRFDPECGSDVLTTEELQNKLKLGVKTKAYVLLLMNLGRIKTTKYKTQIVYKIVS